MSLFVWYFGTRRKYDEVPHHTILLGPRYKELLTDIFERKILADDFSLYLHRPTSTDHVARARGLRCVLCAVAGAASAERHRLERDGRKVSPRDCAANSAIPCCRIWKTRSSVRIMLTPQDFQDRLSSFRGAAFGLEPVLTQSAWFRPHNKSEDIANLYLVGAGTHPGAGLPGVLSSARVLDSLVPDAKSMARPDPVTA